MKNNIKIYLFIALLGIVTACKNDDYLNDGGTSKAFVNMTTYDYLKSNRNFDSLVKAIDRAGLKDAVNGDVTLFATTNYSFVDYVAAKKYKRSLVLQKENFDFGIKDLPTQELSDSLKTYLFAGKINRDQITLEGKLYNSATGVIPNVQYLIKLRRSYEYTQYVNYVDYVTYTRVRGTRDDQEADQNAIPDNQKDNAVDCQTSGIVTTTGIVHVLNGNHRLVFNAERLGN